MIRSNALAFAFTAAAPLPAVAQAFRVGDNAHEGLMQTRCADGDGIGLGIINRFPAARGDV